MRMPPHTYADSVFTSVSSVHSVVNMYSLVPNFQLSTFNFQFSITYSSIVIFVNSKYLMGLNAIDYN